MSEQEEINPEYIQSVELEDNIDRLKDIIDAYQLAVTELERRALEKRVLDETVRKNDATAARPSYIEFTDEELLRLEELLDDCYQYEQGLIRGLLQKRRKGEQ